MTTPADHWAPRTISTAWVVLSGDCRALRRQLRPITWMVLESVALDATTIDGQIIAATSSRRVAMELGIDPGTASAALRQLRDAHLVEVTPAIGAEGRFGLCAYALADVAGLRVMAPWVAPPPTVVPRTGLTGNHARVAVNARSAGDGGPWTARSERPTTGRRNHPSSDDQLGFDLGLEHR